MSAEPRRVEVRDGRPEGMPSGQRLDCAAGEVLKHGGPGCDDEIFDPVRADTDWVEPVGCRNDPEDRSLGDGVDVLGRRSRKRAVEENRSPGIPPQGECEAAG